jgi:DUF971 family protein
MTDIHKGSHDKPNRPRPTRMVVHRKERLLEIAFEDGAVFEIPAELLRVESPSAEVQNHGNKIIVANKRHVALIGAEAVGHYAVKLIFDDGHDSGLYTWDYLYELGRDKERRMRAYLQALKLQGLTRE